MWEFDEADQHNVESYFVNWARLPDPAHIYKSPSEFYRMGLSFGFISLAIVKVWADDPRLDR